MTGFASRLKCRDTLAEEVDKVLLSQSMPAFGFQINWHFTALAPVDPINTKVRITTNTENSRAYGIDYQYLQHQLIRVKSRMTKFTSRRHWLSVEYKNGIAVFSSEGCDELQRHELTNWFPASSGLHELVRMETLRKYPSLTTSIRHGRRLIRVVDWCCRFAPDAGRMDGGRARSIVWAPSAFHWGQASSLSPWRR